MESPLIATKLHIPPARPDWVPRSNLVNVLNGSLLGPNQLFLISAPAGFGKTTLVLQWLRQTQLKVAWLSLDKSDNDPVNFWRYVIAALQTVEPSTGQAALAALEAPQMPPLEPLVSAVINDLARWPEGGILVLDDYHLIETQILHTGLTFLLDHLPPALRLVITTRADPPLALSRRRARNQLVELRTSDLRFTIDEAATFLNRVSQLGLPTEDVTSLENRTEGWIAGLQMAAVSLRRQTDRHAFVEAFAGNDRYVVDYLLEEVLQQQTPMVQSFLLRTSILERLCSSLCETVTGAADSQALLSQLEQANLFIVPLDNQRHWYRYHRLFADLLQRRLRQATDPAEQRMLYRRACDWYEREGYLAESISQALAAPDFHLAAELLERYALRVFFQSETMRVHAWLKAMPEAILRTRPLLCAVYANTIAHASFFQTAALHQAETWLETAERLASDSSGEKLTRSFIALSRAYLAHWLGDAPSHVITLAEQALAGLPPPDPSASNRDYQRLRSGLKNNLGISFLRLGDEEAAGRAFAEARIIGAECGDLLNAFVAVQQQSNLLRRQGRLQEAAALCREALASLRGERRSPIESIPYAGTVYVALGQILLERNELDACEPVLKTGLELSRLTTGAGMPLPGYIAQARLRQARGDAIGALSVLDQAEQDWPEAKGYVNAYRVRLWLMQSQGDSPIPSKIVRWARGRLLTADSRGFDMMESLTLARVLIAQRSTATTRTVHSHPDGNALQLFLEPQIQTAQARGWIERMIELLILQALDRQVENDDGAFDSIQRALELAEPAGFVRLFVDEGRPMRTLIEKWRSRIGNAQGQRNAHIEKIFTAFATSILPGASIAGGSLSQPLIEPLSSREVEVLRLLAAGATNAQIAQSLFITVNTTKKHLTHILGKLGVTDRAAAAARARELGLLT